MRLATSADGAAWISARLHPFGQDVGSVIPSGFAAYVRVFHPPHRLASDGTRTPVRWRDIAAANERSIEAEMQRLGESPDPTRFAPSGEPLWDEQPLAGSVPHDVAVRLAAILCAHTGTPESCWFAVWEGFADLQPQAHAAPVLALPNRNLFVLRGAVADIATTLSQIDWTYRSPNLWWPNDRAWCVATEIDFAWTYVAGSVACVQQLLTHPELEVVPTHPHQGNTCT